MDKFRRNRPFTICLSLSFFFLVVYILSCSSTVPKPSKKTDPIYSKAEIEAAYEEILVELSEIRKLRTSGIVMETDTVALSMTSHAQASIREFVAMKYGAKEQFYVAIQLGFPRSMVGRATSSEEGAGGDADGDGLGVVNATLIIETAPMSLAPYSAFYFLELVEHFKRGAFHRNAGHVLQAYSELDRGKKSKPKSDDEETSDEDESAHNREHVGTENIFTHATGMAWQEYNAAYPHKEWTLGYAGRPGGPAFYISIQDNTNNHGPGSQGSKTEADGCFGRLVRGKKVVARMKKQPGEKDGNGFLNDEKNNIRILGMRLLTVLDS